MLVTGAAGYIGSHTCVELLQAGFAVVALDNLCNSAQEAIARVERITGSALLFSKPPAVALCRLTSCRAARAILPVAMRRPRKRALYYGGAQKKIWMKCVRISGAGKG
ncbi:MAG: NAD-dependent epimerase/dehydratase family protein [Glaciimonas sp.]|nr:NAD-dependent epimerase/dehydratase family protein [Glaciimonas sp.]